MREPDLQDLKTIPEFAGKKVEVQVRVGYVSARST